MERGEIKFLIDEKMGLLSVASGFELSKDLTTNTDRMLSTIQSIVALHGTAKLGESPLGQKLLEVIADTIYASKTQGNVINSFDMDGFTYLIACDGTSVAVLARKQTPWNSSAPFLIAFKRQLNLTLSWVNQRLKAFLMSDKKPSNSIGADLLPAAVTDYNLVVADDRKTVSGKAAYVLKA